MSKKKDDKEITVGVSLIAQGAAGIEPVTSFSSMHQIINTCAKGIIETANLCFDNRAKKYKK